MLPDLLRADKADAVQEGEPVFKLSMLAMYCGIQNAQAHKSREASGDGSGH